MKAPSEIKILVVEDDPFFQRVLLKRLASDGYRVLSANDGREGMKAIVSFEPDLVISDWMMPEVDGLELCQSVKTGLGEAAPYFILLTAKGEISNKLLGLETGADDYLVKPCDQGEIMARVRAGLRIVVLAQELRATVAKLEALAPGSSGSAPGGSGRAPGGSGPALAGSGHGPVTSEPPLPLCADCRQVQAPDGTWMPLETWLEKARGMRFVPGTCPHCRRDVA